MMKLLQIIKQQSGLFFHFCGKMTAPMIFLLLKANIFIKPFLLGGIYSSYFAKCGKGLCVHGKFQRLIGSKHINIGDNVTILENCNITAITNCIYLENGKIKREQLSPQIIIHSNVQIGENNHITSIYSIEIEENVLTGPNVLITDNTHGIFEEKLIVIPPLLRPLTHKGKVIIGKNVWIGEGAAILPGVKIGENSIIGANSVVTKDIPSNCLAVGNPAQIIRQI